MPGHNTDIPLPAGWELAQDYDGKLYFIDHNTKKTTWVDPRDRYMKPQKFSDCVGNELPLGWEESYDSQIGVYYIDHFNEITQLEDPRLQWRSVQEEMLRDYLVTAREDLFAKKEICSIKSQRLTLAQDEFKHLNNTLTNLNTSHTSLCSNASSTCTKYDPDLLKADVSLAKNRVCRLKHELDQIRNEVKCKEQGFEKLSLVEQKLASQHEVYNINQAQAIYNELRNIQKSLLCGEQEKAQLLQSLASLRDDLSKSQQNEAVADLVVLQKFDTASQTDLTGEIAPIGARLAEMARVRLQYDELRKKVHAIQQQIADLEDKVSPDQTESDKDRLLLIQEKEQLLRELRSINEKGRSESEVVMIRSEIAKLEKDLNVAMEMSNRTIADRLKIHEQKNMLIQQLKDLLRQTAHLESQLRSLSASTLSMSSSSSLGSLSTSSSKGSLSSISFSDIYGTPQCTADTGLCDLHRRVEKLLQGGNSFIERVPDANENEDCPPPSYKSVEDTVERISDLKISSVEEKKRLHHNAACVDSNLSPNNELNFPPQPPLSPIKENHSDPGLQGPDLQSNAQASVSAAVSNESVAGDSGVFEASNKRIEDNVSRLSQMNLETAQVQVKLRYSRSDTFLHVGLERARNLSALQIPPEHQVCIKAVLLPTLRNNPLGGATRFSSDLDKPTFGETLRLLVPVSKLCTKTLQVNVCSISSSNEEECLGCAQVSLADFCPESSTTKWYNVLSFRFMQPELESSSPGQAQNINPAPSVKDAACLCHNSTSMVNSKEESSDESTIISSQTSTLTRNQVPMLSDGHLREEESEDSEEVEVLSCQCLNHCLCQSELIESSTGNCDKETNTECVFLPEKNQKYKLGGQEKSVVIKRSQTFSPSAVDYKAQYNCRLNRSDSDSSMPLYRRGASFKRNSVERRSLRWKKSPSTKVHHRSSSADPCATGKHNGAEQRTSIDLELDLQASQTKLLALQKDLTRLRELKHRLEDVKSNGIDILPSWIADNEQIMKVLSVVNKEGTTTGAEEKRINKLLKKTSREIYKLRKNRHQQPNVISFREKIAFFTKTHQSVSSILHSDSENDEDTSHGQIDKTSPAEFTEDTKSHSEANVRQMTIEQLLKSEDNPGVEV